MCNITKKDIRLPLRKKTAKKGDNGKVLAVGGSKDYAGAVALAGIAAMRSGADWVTIAAPEKVAWAVNCLSADLVTVKLEGDYFSLRHLIKVEDLARNHDMLLIGNGIGLKKETQSFLKSIIKKSEKLKKMLVVDADAIKLLSSNDLKNSILTPHIKELEIFLLNSKIKNSILKKIINEKNITKKALLIKNNLWDFFNKNNVLLLKGPVAAIISKDGIFLNKNVNPGMTKAGTGDVLAGLCAGFLAQGNTLLQSAINATYFCGLIEGILEKKKKGFTYLASDMAEEIKRVLH